MARVIDNPTAMHMTNNNAPTSRVMPRSMWLSTMSMTPLSKGTPGIKKSTLVPMAMSGVASNSNDTEAIKDETRVDMTKMT